MKRKRDISTPCVVRASEGNLRECRIMEPVRKLMALGSSINSTEHFDICQPVMQAICEYARLDSCEMDGVEAVTGELEATIKVIEDQLRGIEMESEMLKLRKRALKRRLQVLGKLANSLKSTSDNPMTA
ncbi:MAG: hypothetical protein ABFD49_11075 [Armatimonadota bacterium]|nr:hypothetical protein [bacterium]